MRDLLQEFGGSNNPDVVDMVVNLLREKSKQLECDEPSLTLSLRLYSVSLPSGEITPMSLEIKDDVLQR